MKVLLQLVSSLLLIIFVTLAIVRHSEFQITKGSSLSTSSSETTYWLSPNGAVSFGFYPLCPDACDQYVIGIWFVKSTNKTLVWVANRDDPPLNGSSKILLTREGELLLQVPGGLSKFLPGEVSKPISYAVMNDNGNFVLYDYSSQVIWQSFDHPTNTILGGQKLSSGQRLISSVSMFNHSYGSSILKIRQASQGFAINKYYKNSDSESWHDAYKSWYKISSRKKVVTPITLNLDAITGRLYSVDGNNMVLKNYTKGENQTQLDNTTIYRATLDIDGVFRLYKEKIGSEGEKSVQLWDSKSHQEQANLFRLSLRLFSAALLSFFCIVICLTQEVNQRRKQKIEDLLGVLLLSFILNLLN